MCGIVGVLAKSDVVSSLVHGLKMLEYRGYDSAGVATSTGGIKRVRAEGKIVNLEEALKQKPITGNIGIGHTRWATHGVPSKANSHPHASEDVCVVHNGIIENFLQLRKELEAKGVVFGSQTDTEVIPHMISQYLKEGLDELQAVEKTIAKLDGAYALGIVFASNPDLLIAVKHGSPLAVGYSDEQFSIGSDSFALSSFAKRVSFLEDGDIAKITHDGIELYNAGKAVERDVKPIIDSNITAGKGDYRHYMQKEIFEQPTILGTSLKRYYHPVTQEISLPDFPFDIADIENISIVACGSSYFAGMMAKYYFEKYARVAVEVDVASEYRYRKPVFRNKNLVIVISQSGETADTLAALRYANENNQHSLAVVNVAESSIAREADAIMQIYAGPEIGVASTKALTAQMIIMQLLALAFGSKNGNISGEDEQKFSQQLAHISTTMMEIFESEPHIKKVANELSQAQDILYIGRGEMYPIALEGALKIKELTYIHAEALAAGELKHGYIALVDEDLPIIALAPSDELFEKTASNIRETATRGGKIILISDKKGIEALADSTYMAIEIPETNEFSAPISYTTPMQLLSYYAAVYKGTDVDQPRNLAKSVTVE